MVHSLFHGQILITTGEHRTQMGFHLGVNLFEIYPLGQQMTGIEVLEENGEIQCLFTAQIIIQRGLYVGQIFRI